MTNFTPGPWLANWDDEWQRHVVDAGRDGVCVCCPLPNEDAANAQLIAAAPDLYARLRESTALLRSALPPAGKDTTRLYGSVEKQIAANEAALKKAEGE